METKTTWIPSNWMLVTYMEWIFFKWKLTQQQALTVIWIVFRPGWQTRFRYNGRCELLWSPRSMTRGLAFADTWTLTGQLVYIWISSWWKHFNCSSKSGLHWSYKTNYYYMFDICWNIWPIEIRLIWKKKQNFHSYITFCCYHKWMVLLPIHESLVNRWLQLEYMITDRQIVF